MKSRLKSLFVLFIIVAAIVGFFWIANFLGSGEKVESEKPLVICQPKNTSPDVQKCFWTAHIHATVRIFKGGKEIPVKFEEGKLEGQHTHAERQKLHWHGLIPVNPKTKEVSDWSALEVQRIITDFKLSQEGTPMFVVNNKKVDSSYIWKDGNTIEIRYE